VSNLLGLVTGMASDYQGLNGALLTRRQVYSCFLDAENFIAGNPDADPTQEVVTRWVVEQLATLTAMNATFTLSQPTETDGLMTPGRIMLADVCNWVYRSEECGYAGAAVADEFNKPTTDLTKDKCSHGRHGCELRNNLDSIGCFFSIAKLSR
jgi:lambda family phage minor tail protein L